MKIFENGKFYLEKGRFCEAVLTDGETIRAVGGRDEMHALAGLAPAVVDCCGRTVLPGLNDSHMHLSCIAAANAQADLSGCRSIGQIVDTCRAFIASRPESAARGIRSMGWNQDLFEGEKRIPNRFDLDRISTEIPIVLERVCGHICVTNTKVLELMGIDVGATPPEGGTIGTDSEGKPNGVFTENAVAWVEQVIPDFTFEEKVRMFADALDTCAACGLTSIQSNDVGAPNVYGDSDSIRTLFETGRATIRYRHQITFDDPEALNRFCDTEARRDIYKGNRLTIGPLKLFKDGSLGARTALMRRPYADDPCNCGVEALSDEKQEGLCRAAAARGMQVITHVIGDAAVEKTVGIYERMMNGGPNTLRHALVHCQITDRPLLERIARLGVLAMVQPIFLDYDMHVVESRCGRELASTSYAFETLRRLGGHVSYGTDAPVESCNPFPNLYSAVTRKDKDGYPKDGFFPQECVGICDAVDAYTLESAYAEFAEGFKGRIRPGYLADFTVLSDDIFTIEPDGIRDIAAEMTVVGGEIVYRRG